MTEQQHAGEALTEDTFSFQAESRQLLNLMIHSLYSNRELFLRELISNASDAVDKLRFDALSNADLLEGDTDFRIKVDYDVEAATLSVTDNGIGMSRQEVIDNIGTIARSGTSRFLQSLTGDDKKDAQLIGRFGIGFYSSFIVAGAVEVLTRRAGETAEQGTRFRSTGKDKFHLSAHTRPERGTCVLLHLKPEATDLLDGFKLRQIITKYADHLSVAVLMPIEQPATAEADAENAQPSEEAPADAENAPASEEAPADADDYEVINQTKALWTRPRNDIKDEEYEEFYKLISHNFEPPAAWSHNRLEGRLEYTSLLFLPKRAPFDIYNREAPRGLKLYVQRMFIMDDAEQFLPLYLRFVRGIIDSNDLPLNVSRELLQEDRNTQSMRNALTKRVLDMIGNLAEKKPDEYIEYWREFGAVLKEGLIDDPGNLDILLKLLRFPVALQDDNAPMRSLADYVAGMSKEQDAIYYLLGDDAKIARQSPHLEILKAKGLDVILCCDRIDAWAMLQVEAFDGKDFQDITRTDLDLAKFAQPENEAKGEAADKDKASATTEIDKAFIDKIAAVLEQRVKEVRVSQRLTDSPACLVSDSAGISRQMRQLMAQTTGQTMPESKPIFEFNPKHPLVERLSTLAGADFDNMVLILFDQAILAEGNMLEEPVVFVRRLNSLLAELTQ